MTSDPSAVDPESALSEPDPPGRKVSGRTVVATLGVGMLTVFGLMAVARMVAPGLNKARLEASRVQCAANLRVLGDGARRQAQDTGRFGHQASALETLDGDVQTSDAPRIFRAMVERNYLDDPASLVCPAKPRLRRGQREGEAEQKRWLRTGEGVAPSLATAIPISYGWTRRGLTRDAAATIPLAADKAVVPRQGVEGVMKGNHTEGWTLLRAGGAIEFLRVFDDPFPGSWLAKIKTPTDGFLAISDQDDPKVFGR